MDRCETDVLLIVNPPNPLLFSNVNSVFIMVTVLPVVIPGTKRITDDGTSRTHVHPCRVSVVLSESTSTSHSPLPYCNLTTVNSQE